MWKKKIRIWVRQVPAWMCFSNISSWSVFWPLGGACCSWHLRSKAAQQRTFNAWMMNVGETLPIVIYFRSIFTAEEREQSAMSDIKGSKATAVARVSTYLRDFTLQKNKKKFKKKAKTLTGFCTQGSVEKNKRVCGSKRMKFCCENEHLSVTQSSGSSHRACHRLQLSVITQHDNQIGRLFVTKLLSRSTHGKVLHMGMECETLRRLVSYYKPTQKIFGLGIS